MTFAEWRCKYSVGSGYRSGKNEHWVWWCDDRTERYAIGLGELYQLSDFSVVRRSGGDAYLTPKPPPDPPWTVICTYTPSSATVGGTSYYFFNDKDAAERWGEQFSTHTVRPFAPEDRRHVVV